MTSLLRSKRKRSIVPYLAIGACVAFGAIVITFVVRGLMERTPPPVAMTLCPAAGPAGHVVLLVDRSDPMSFAQRKAFAVAYRDIVARVPTGHLLSVYALSDDFKETAEPLLELCNPGDGKDATGMNDNPGMLKRAFEKQYLKPFQEREEDLVTESPGKASPILEMVQLVGITGFRKQGIAGEKRLIIVSDMIQNTPQLRMYKGVPDYTAFSKTPYGVKSRADLQDVKVEFRMLMNTPAIQDERMFEFWKSHIRQSGGRVVLHDPING